MNRNDKKKITIFDIEKILYNECGNCRATINKDDVFCFNCGCELGPLQEKKKKEIDNAIQKEIMNRILISSLESTGIQKYIELLKSKKLFNEFLLPILPGIICGIILLIFIYLWYL